LGGTEFVLMQSNRVGIYIFTLIATIVSFNKLAAQRPQPPGNDFPTDIENGGRPGGSILSDFLDTDSISLAYYYKEFAWDTLYRGDTSLYAFHHIYDPARRRTWDYLHIGLPGSPARPVYFEKPYIEGNHMGVSVFDIYTKKASKMPFFLPERPVADLAYLRGADQDDFVFDAIFSNTFENGLNFSMDYERLAQVGDYRNQRSRNTNLTMGLNYKWWKDKVNSYFIFANNAFLMENSGGIRDESVYGDPRFNTRAGIETYLGNSRSRYELREFELYNTIEAPFTSRYPLRLYNSLTYSRERYLFFQTAPYDLDYFGIFANDTRGVRHGVEISKFRNELGLEWEAESLAGIDIDKIRAGLVQNWISWIQEPNTRQLNEFHVFAEGYLTLFKRMVTKGRYQQGLLDAAGNSHVLLEGKLKLPADFNLTATYERSSILPSLIDQSVNVNFQNVYRTNFGLQRFNTLKGGISWKRTKSTLEVGLQRGIDLIVYNINGIPEQIGDAVNILQVAAIQELNIWHFKWYHYLLFQASSTTQLGIPPLFYKSTLFYEREFFRGKSPLRIGADFRTLTTYQSLTFLPIHAQWAYQTESNQILFPEIDVFVSLKVKVFKAFVRFENVLGTVNNKPLFHHYRYPMHEQRLSFGIQWILPD